MDMERSHSGLLRSLGKRVYRKVSRVRIPLSPPSVLFIGYDPNGSNPRPPANYNRQKGDFLFALSMSKG